MVSTLERHTEGRDLPAVRERARELAAASVSANTFQARLRGCATPPGGPVGTVGSVNNAEIKLGSVDVDAYNASSLIDDLLVRDPVELPFLAVQNGDDGTPAAIETIKAYVSDQVGAADGVSSTAGDIDAS